jgi:hypothetical protein
VRSGANTLELHGISSVLPQPRQNGQKRRRERLDIKHIFSVLLSLSLSLALSRPTELRRATAECRVIEKLQQVDGNPHLELGIQVSTLD